MNTQSKTNDSAVREFLTKTGVTLSVIAAAFINKKLDYFPREKGKNEPIEPNMVIGRISNELNNLTFADENDAKYHLDQVKAGYNEVKAATEYQDQKTGRLLTILAFLTAAAGAIFTKVLDIYPLDFSGPSDWHRIITLTVYALFALYLLLIALGAMMSFYAMQTRFVFSRKEKDTVEEKLKSLLFFKYITITKPETWAKEFTRQPKDLLTTYVKHYIIETYLIAAKTSDKVRCLQPAQNILQIAIKVLVVWIIALIVAVCVVPRATPANVGQLPSTQKPQTTPAQEQTTTTLPTVAAPERPPALTQPSARKKEPGRESPARSAPAKSGVIPQAAEPKKGSEHKTPPSKDEKSDHPD